MNKVKFLIGCLIILVLSGLIAGCAGGPQSATEDASLIYTQAVHTVSAQLTLDAGNTAVALLTQMAQATATSTLPPSETPTSTPVPPTFTLPPPSPTPPPPTPTTPAGPCDWLQFISDVTVPDGKEYLPGTQFVKTWRVQNIGSCTWTREYDLVFSSGDQMSGASAVPLAGDIPPGAMADLSVTLTAPATEGTYTGYWQMRNANGVLFGGGGNADQPFYVRIQVDAGDTIFYDMAQAYCKAEWINSRLTLQCPTPIQDEVMGYVYLDNSPLLETGNQDNEPALVTHPDAGGTVRFEILGEQGLIAGIYPAKLIEEGDRFEAVIGCMFGYEECNVLFYLLIQKPNGNYEALASWQEYYDGRVQQVSVDLSEWAGKEIRLVLAVVANGSSLGDGAFWLYPRIMR
jgi:hypothetical protein